MLQSGLKKWIARDYFAWPQGHQFDAVLNFVGAGNPETIQRLGKRVFSITEQFDRMVLEHLEEDPNCLYIFMSSGAVFGDNFSTPVNNQTRSVFPINNLQPQHYYGLAKAQAEYRHRMSDGKIVDLRIFNYFSSSADLNASFMICGMMRAIMENKDYVVDKTPLTRDFIGPRDFYNMINILLSQERINTAVDIYSRLPISKDMLIANLEERYGLKVRTQHAPLHQVTGVKENYYSTNLEAYTLGYRPTLTSLETIFEEADKILK